MFNESCQFLVRPRPGIVRRWLLTCRRRAVSTRTLDHIALPRAVTHIGVHHVHGRVDVVLHEQLTGMGERLADVSVVGEDLEVGVDTDVPMGRTTLIVACSTLPHIYKG